MALVLHLGAHATDDGLIGQWLTQGADRLAGQGVAAMPSRPFLQTISQALAGRSEGPASAGQEAELLRALGVDEQRPHLAVSAPGLLGPAAEVIAPSGFYVKDVARRIYGLRLLFPRSRLHLMLAIRRPGGFLPALLRRPGMPPAEALLPHLLDDGLPWSALVLSLRRHAPQAALTIWRHEDLPRIWPQVLARLSTGGETGASLPVLDPALLEATLPLATAALSAEAELRLRRYLGASPPADMEQLRRLCDAFALRFGHRSQTDAPRAAVPADGDGPMPVPVPPPLPGWAEAQIARLDAGYDTEWDDIANIDGVQMLN